MHDDVAAPAWPDGFPDYARRRIAVWRIVAEQEGRASKCGRDLSIAADVVEAMLGGPGAVKALQDKARRASL